MESKNAEQMTWGEAFAGRFRLGQDGGRSRAQQYFADVAGRTVLVAKMRWLLLTLIGIYGLGAGSIFFASYLGFFLSATQMTVLLLSLVAVAAYNALYHFFYEKIRQLPWIDHLQIVLDLLFVTLIIHYSGGTVSWFWPVYLVVTIEAAVLLERKREVFCIGVVGGLLYGSLLVVEAFDLVPYVEMPFIDLTLHHDPLYLVLMWFWVSVLNATVALVAAFLMSVLRGETAALRQSEERLVDFLETASDLIFSFTPEGKVVYANRAWKKALGYDPAELLSLNVLSILHKDCRSACIEGFRKALGGAKVEPIEGSLVARDGHLIAVQANLACSSGGAGESVLWGVCRDITEQKEAREQLYHMAHHDMLTGLPNRILFKDRLKQARALAKRHQHQLAVLFLDLDRFKIINDTLGHAAGDIMLKETARRLTSCVREVDTVARLGGDEFTVILGELKDDEAAEKVARKILKALAKPLVVEESELFITTSIGIAMYPDHVDDPAALIKAADIAMYHAKAQGRNNFQFYAPDMEEGADNRLTLANGMRRALENDEFRIHYQPKLDIESGEVTALEALLRWDHPELGMIPPAEFIALAEENGLIIQIGEWVLREACAQNRAWQDEGLPKVRVAVNLSAYQLRQSGLVETVQSILEETGLDADFLELEITETAIMQNPDFAVSILNELREVGAHISIDDFGTGYSSLAHIKRFTINNLKIDKSFVRDVEINRTDAAIAKAIIAMGSSLNLTVIAEGVETEGQLSFLKDQRCDEVQGFLFSRPVPAEEVAEVLRRGCRPRRGPARPEDVQVVPAPL